MEWLPTVVVPPPSLPLSSVPLVSVWDRQEETILPSVSSFPIPQSFLFFVLGMIVYFTVMFLWYSMSDPSEVQVLYETLDHRYQYVPITRCRLLPSSQDPV
jgi:hypothetical protein